MIKNGARLQSQVCDTQVIVVKVTESLEDLRCGGALMIPIGDPFSAAEINPALSGGSAMGKRYVDGGAAEVLVTKAGRGTLSIGDRVLELKQAHPLPASD